MKIGLLGDIHANSAALTAVLSSARLLEVETLLVTGDLVGYYFSPREVLDMLREWDAHIVRGNHEDMLIQAISSPEFLEEVDRRYGSGLRIALDALEQSDIEWLSSLPHPKSIKIEDCNILLCHGAYWDIDFYVYPDAQNELLERCAVKSYDLVVQGHTHYPMKYKFGDTLLVNPGSVGQPRNRQPGAHWAIFDTNTREVHMLCEKYDASAIIDASRTIHPELPYLSEVLLRK